jgi:hypothetical protein
MGRRETLDKNSRSPASLAPGQIDDLALKVPNPTTARSGRTM